MAEDDCVNTAGMYRRDTWRDKLRRRLWPAHHCDPPAAPAAFKDVLVTRIRVELNWWGRLSLFVSGRLIVESKAVTENVIGAHFASSASWVMPPKWLERNVEGGKLEARPHPGEAQ